MSETGDKALDEILGDVAEITQANYGWKKGKKAAERAMGAHRDKYANEDRELKGQELDDALKETKAHFYAQVMGIANPNDSDAYDVDMAAQGMDQMLATLGDGKDQKLAELEQAVKYGHMEKAGEVLRDAYLASIPNTKSAQTIAPKYNNLDPDQKVALAKYLTNATDLRTATEKKEAPGNYLPLTGIEKALQGMASLQVNRANAKSNSYNPANN